MAPAPSMVSGMSVCLLLLTSPDPQQPEIVSVCRSKGIALEAYSPLVQGTKAKDPTLVKIAEEVGQSWAKVLIRWSLQRG